MRKDDLCITVPTFFRCPISLDVMKSPVSLCTGVTYDRASIQRWLDGGNNTCPATMQILQNKDFIPNRTLQRLIEIWSDSVRRRTCVESAELAAPTRDEIADAIDRVKIEKEERDDREVLSKIVRFGRESDDNRGFLAGKDDFVILLVDLINQVDFETTSAAKSLVVQEAVKILSTIRSKVSDRRRFSNLILTNGRDRLSVIVYLFKTGNVELKIDCAGLLEFIAVDAESKLLIAERDGLITELMKSISKDSDLSLIESSLSCLIAISSPKRVKLNLLREKLIGDVTKLLSDSTSSLSVSVTEKCLKLLEILASTKEGRSEICGGDGECLKTVVKKLMKVSTAATEHAVTVLWSVSYLFKEDKALEAVTSVNGVTKILLLLQSNCSPAVRRMLTDLLKVFKVNSRSCLSAYDTKTTHIMPF
ncbi:U-box domain-containing protein 27 [Arabidopsis thaliana]|uniref:U-box domain-containing protein n=2 Tax=Arabidopsis TaxID=3701 RepID=A0A178UAA5_ARATH|nr:U box domain [Arabidopsis thaliana x Arabidopsis arenosa]OAO90600.1 CMPG2 [Arabidopsis thaliana]